MYPQHTTPNSPSDAQRAATLPAFAVIIIASAAIVNLMRRFADHVIIGGPFDPLWVLEGVPSTLVWAALILTMGQATNPVRWLSVCALIVAAVGLLALLVQTVVVIALQEISFMALPIALSAASAVLAIVAAALGVAGKAARNSNARQPLLLWSLILASIALLPDLSSTLQLVAVGIGYLLGAIASSLALAAAVALISWPRPEARIVGLALLGLLVGYYVVGAATDTFDHLGSGSLHLLVVILNLAATLVAFCAAIVLTALSIPPLNRSRTVRQQETSAR